MGDLRSKLQRADSSWDVIVEKNNIANLDVCSCAQKKTNSHRNKGLKCRSGFVNCTFIVYKSAVPNNWMRGTSMHSNALSVVHALQELLYIRRVVSLGTLNFPLCTFSLEPRIKTGCSRLCWDIQLTDWKTYSTQTRTYVHTYIHTHTHTYIRTYIHTYIHT